ncbi:MAG TPA: murein biosynthesis integral membrane protein MurJ [Anaerolineae bacterium]
MTPSTRQITRAAGIVMATFIVSRVLGLARDVVISAHFGTSGEYDAYVTAFRIPDIIFTLMAGGALASAFIPTFSGYLARSDEDGAWQLASSIINLVFVVLSVSALLAALFAEPIVTYLLAPGFSPDKVAITVPLMRLLLISPVIFGVSGVVMGILNARQQFWLPGLAPSMYNLSIIAGAILVTDIFGLALGAVIGSVLHLLVQVPGLIRLGARYTPRLSLHNPAVRQVLRLMAPRILGLAVVQINFVVETSLGSRLGTGTVSALNYAWRVMLLPQGIVAQSVATAAFPTFADQFARGQIEQLRSALSATLRAILFIAIPAAVGLLVLSMPLVQLLFERGEFQDTSTGLVGTALAFYALGLIGHSGIEILTRAFYALHDTRTPVQLGVVSLILNLILSLSLIGPMHIAGLALANTVAAITEMILLVITLRSRLGGLDDRRVAIAALKTGAASLVMAVGVWGFLNVTQNAGAVMRGVGGIVTGGLVFGAAALLLRVAELQGALQWVGGRIGIRRKT